MREDIVETCWVFLFKRDHFYFFYKLFIWYFIFICLGMDIFITTIFLNTWEKKINNKSWFWKCHLNLFWCIYIDYNWIYTCNSSSIKFSFAIKIRLNFDFDRIWLNFHFQLDLHFGFDFIFNSWLKLKFDWIFNSTPITTCVVMLMIVSSNRSLKH